MKIEIEEKNQLGISGYMTDTIFKESDIVELYGTAVSGEKTLLSNCSPKLYRPDLTHHGKSAHPYCAFILPIPTPDILDSKFSKYTIEYNGYEQLSINQLEPVRNQNGVSAKTIINLSSNSFYGISGSSINNNILSINGVLTPPEGDFSKIILTPAKGLDVKFHFPLFNKPSGDYYWYVPGCPYFGYRIDIDLTKSTISHNSAISLFFEIVDDKNGINNFRNITIPTHLSDYTNLPDEFNVQRVQFLSRSEITPITGATDAFRMATIAKKYASSSAPLTIADWGCGFGRVLKFIPQFISTSKLYGIEIDDLNFDWLSKNLNQLTPIKCDLSAKIDIKTNTIDFLYGISVVTHIRPIEQKAWLEEIKRILKPGGIVALTFGSSNSMAFSSRWLTKKNLNDFEKHGYLVLESASKYDKDIAGGNYYVQTKMRHDFIRSLYGKYFDILDILPGIFGYQDVIVMKKP